MSITSEDVSGNLSLDISAGRRPVRRKQARNAKGKFSFTPMRRLSAVIRVLIDAAAKVRSRGLTLELPEYTVSFASPAEFEFSLLSRTEYPIRKLSALMKRSADDLQVTASNIRQVEKRFARALAESLHDPAQISELLGGIEIKLFSKDHQWRDIASALNQLGSAHDVYKRVALVKYLQYLGSRQDVLRSLYLAKIRAEMEAADRATEGTGNTGTETPAARANQERAVVVARTSAGIVDTRVLSPRDTAIFHVEQIQIEGDTEGFAFLPRGETVEVTVTNGECLELLLSAYRVKLYPGQRYRLTDEDGHIHILATGKSVVGRHISADIVVAPENRSISRNHLMVEPLSPNRLRLTDLSSHGTSIPMQHMTNPN